MAHCEREGSWRREPIRSWLLKHAQKSHVILELPSGAELLRPTGATEKLRKVGVHPSGNRLYVPEAEFDRFDPASLEAMGATADGVR